jgi:putative endonuclease
LKKLNLQMKDTRREKGVAGEERAAAYLKQQGFIILNRNWRTRSGEIDIIAMSSQDVLVFVEVKTLPGGDAQVLAHELNKKKQQRITKTAKCFLLNNRQYSNSSVRFDVIVIDMPGVEPVYHIENAFSGLL